MAEWIALAAVISTVVVGLAGLITTFLAPAWSQRRVEQRRETRSFRKAQRLVANELDYGRAMLNYIARVGQMPTVSVLDRDLAMTAWEAQQGELGAALDNEVWEALRLAYIEFGLAVASLRRLAPAHEPPPGEQLPDVPDHLRGKFPETCDGMSNARRMLLAAEPLAD